MRGRTIALVLGLALYLVAVPAIFQKSSYWMTVGVDVSLLAFTSLGVWLTFAIGRINIAQGAFALVGGYAAAILCSRFGWSFWLALPVSGFVAAVLGALLGSVILRLRGVYFAMLTLCLTEAARLLSLNWTSLTKGASGIVDIPSPFQGDSSYVGAYYFAAVLLILGLLVVNRIMQSRIGGIFRTIHADEDLAASVGIPVARYRVLAFAAACFFGGVGGAASTIFLQSIYPTSFDVATSTNFMLYCFLGGLHEVAGPAVGALALFLGFQLLQVFGAFQNLVYAGLMIAAMLLLPNGLMSLPQRFSLLKSKMARSKGIPS